MNDNTYEGILQRALERIPEKVGKRQSDPAYQGVAPACAELAQLYDELMTMIDRAFVDTAQGEDLKNLLRSRGLEIYDATFALRKGVFTSSAGGPATVPIGFRFMGGSINFKVVQGMSPGEYQLESETAGEAGNEYIGTLIPIGQIELGSATLTDVLIPGEEAESDEKMRIRYYDSLEGRAFGGNRADYKERLESLQGVGGAKVLPVWPGGYKPADLTPPQEAGVWFDSDDCPGGKVGEWLNVIYATSMSGLLSVGGGTVQVVFIASDGLPPSSELVNEVQTAIDPIQNRGEGMGLAPIGHCVYVAGVRGVNVDISFALVLESGREWSHVAQSVRDAAEGYFAQLRAVWADSEYLVVRVAQLETRVLGVSGVIDVTETLLNNKTGNLQLKHDEIPLVGVILSEAN